MADMLQSGLGRVLLALQVAAQATIKTQTQLTKVLSKGFRLAKSEWRKHIVIVCAERSLAVSNQVDAAQVRWCPL